MLIFVSMNCGRCVVQIIFFCIALPSLVDCCSQAEIWNPPLPQNIAIGESATFDCNGKGSSIAWFINGVNTENMPDQEVQENGLDVYVSDDPFLKMYCLIISNLTLIGNSVTKNSIIECTIFADGISSSSKPVELIVKTPKTNSQATDVNFATVSVLMTSSISSTPVERILISQNHDYSIPINQIDDEGVSYTVTVCGDCIIDNITAAYSGAIFLSAILLQMAMIIFLLSKLYCKRSSSKNEMRINPIYEDEIDYDCLENLKISYSSIATTPAPVVYDRINKQQNNILHDPKGLEVQQTTTNSAYGIQQYKQSYEDDDYEKATSFHEE